MENNSSTNISIPGYLRLSKVIAYLLYIWVIIGVISLVLRIFLLLFSANPTTPFVEFVYKVSGNYLDPFRGIFEARPVGETGYFDVASLFAVIIYLFIMWGFSALIHYVQNKIDINLHKQEKELRELKQQKLLEAQKAAAAANKPTARSRQV